MGKYDAWIPNVSGAISFSNIKGMRVPGRAKCPKTINHLGRGTGPTITSFQERNLSDTLYSVFDRGGWFCYLLIAEVKTNPQNEEVLAGNVYTYPKMRLDKSQKELVENFVDNTSAPVSLRDSWAPMPEAVCVSFALNRDGHIELRYDGGDRSNESSFIFEAFSFLKDLVHCHKFHRHDDDAIVVPYPQDPSLPHRWLNQTIRNIHKSIVSSYRNANTRTDIQNALGRLSYLESLQESAKKYVAQTDPTINTQALRTSLEARLATVGEIEDRKSVILQITVPTILAVIGLLIAMIQLLQVPCISGLTASDECKKNNPDHLPFALQDGAIDMVQYLLANWLHYAMLLPVICVAIFVIAYRKHVFRWISSHWGHGVFGGILRVVFSIAATSGRFGQVAATFLVLVSLFGILLALYRGLFGNWPSLIQQFL